MKGALSILFIGMILLFGCSKVETENPVLNTAIGEDFIEVQVIDLKTYEAITDMVRIPVSELQTASKDESNLKISSNVISASGHFTNPLGTSISFSVIHNNAGVHGQGQYWGSDGILHLSSECIQVIGNDAIFSQTITQSTVPGLMVGYTFINRVKDNGEGINCPPDQYSDYGIIAGGSLCDYDLFWAWDYIWDNIFYPMVWTWTDVTSGGNIQVSN